MSKEMKERSKEYEKRKSWSSHVEQRAALLEWYNVTGTAKTKAVQDYLADLLESQRKFICFAHHQAMMGSVAEILEKKKVRYIRIEGATSSSDRNDFVRQFQSDDATLVALLSITAANSGLTLTAAKMVVFAELFWNPGVLTQAEDRAHRIGQSDSVAVKYLVAKGTADDVLWPMLQKKLDVLNQAGLSKDNFQDSEATSAKAATPKKRDSQGSSCSRTASS